MQPCTAGPACPCGIVGLPFRLPSASPQCLTPWACDWSCSQTDSPGLGRVLGQAGNPRGLPQSGHRHGGHCSLSGFSSRVSPAHHRGICMPSGSTWQMGANRLNNITLSLSTEPIEGFIKICCSSSCLLNYLKSLA